MSSIEFKNKIRMVKSYSKEHWELSQQTEAIYNQENWLEDALYLDVYLSKSARLRNLVDKIYNKVATVISIQSRKRTRDALKTVLINLWYGWFYGDGRIRYSRDRSAYTRDSRYGKIFFKYDRIIPVIDALECIWAILNKSKDGITMTKGLVDKPVCGVLRNYGNTSLPISSKSLIFSPSSILKI